MSRDHVYSDFKGRCLLVMLRAFQNPLSRIRRRLLIPPALGVAAIGPAFHNATGKAGVEFTRPAGAADQSRPSLR